MRFKLVESKIFIVVYAVMGLLGFVFTADAQQFIVRTIYFQPTDAPGPTPQISELLTETQDFFRSEMERHGYGAKTFRHETDGNGNIDIHIIKGKHKADHYLQDTYRRVGQELPFKFTLDPIAKDNVHVIVIGGMNELDNGSVGYAWYYHGDKSGGVAVIGAKALEFRLVAHEIGHTFGLKHTGLPGALMGSSDDRLLDYETHWLDRHHFFNDTQIRNNLPQFVKILPIEALKDRMVRFKIVAQSKNGLYHAQMYVHRWSFVIGATAIQGKDATFEIDARRGYIRKDNQVSIQIMDIHGNNVVKNLGNITLPEPIPDPEVVVEETVECPECTPPNDETDLAVDPRWRLATQWAALKQR